MAIEIDVVMQLITHAVIEATKVAVQPIMEETGDETVGYRSEEAGVRPKLGGPSTIFNFTKEIKNICKTYNVDQAKNAYFFKTC